MVVHASTYPVVYLPTYTPYLSLCLYNADLDILYWKGDIAPTISGSTAFTLPRDPTTFFLSLTSLPSVPRAPAINISDLAKFLPYTHQSHT